MDNIKASYKLKASDNTLLEASSCKVSFDQERLTVSSQFGQPIYITLRDMMDVTEEDYHIYITLMDGSTLIIHDLGYKHDDFFRQCLKIRNTIILKDMLAEETLIKSGVNADIKVIKDQQETEVIPACELRLYESALIIFSSLKAPIRILYCDMEEIFTSDYEININTDTNETYVIAKLGKKFEAFTRAFSKMHNEVLLRAQTLLKALLPGVSPLIIREASQHLKDGKAAKKTTLDDISPILWQELEEKLELIGVKEDYDFLKDFAESKKMCMGIKRGLLGDMTGEYLWFLFPIYHQDNKIPGNVIAMEAMNTEGKSQATYFFKMMSRKTYAKKQSKDVLDQQADWFLDRINRCMLAINFRREPIYLSEEKLNDPRYEKYKTSIALIPELRDLRDAFIGRVIHGSLAQWQKDVLALLKFNVQSKVDKEKWEK